jgi:AAA domain-containing protein
VRDFLKRRGLTRDSATPHIKKERPLPQATPFKWRKLPPREWLFGQHYIRKFVTATISPGGIGKSSNAIVEALAMATGRQEMPLRIVSGKRIKLKVWYVCGEDPRDEIERRFQAAMIHFGIKPKDVEGYLFIDSGRESNFMFATEAERKGVTIAQPVVASVMESIKSNGIDVLILDPFVSFHSVPESDNTKVQQRRTRGSTPAPIAPISGWTTANPTCRCLRSRRNGGSLCPSGLIAATTSALSKHGTGRLRKT